MANELKKLEKRKEELKRRIELASEHKRDVIHYVQSSVLRYKEGELNYHEYYNTIEETFGEKTPQEWVDYYDDYISGCNRLLENCDKEIRKEKLKNFTKSVSPFVIGIFFFVLLFFFVRPQLTGLIISEGLIVEKNYTQELNLLFNESSNYTLEIENLGNLNFIKLSGSIEGEGAIKVYLLVKENEFLILDSDKLQITGNKSVENETSLTIPIKEFNEICEETCSLFDFNLNETSYTLKIEIQNNALIEIREVSYGIIFKEIKEIKEKIPQAPQAPINITENITKIEKKTPKGKSVNLKIPRGLENSKIKETIPKEWNIKDRNSIKLFWEEENKFVDFNALDSNNDGIIDEIEWLVENSGAQNFNIIVITKAEHLDSDKEFISNIYEEVKELDGIWSEEIKNNEYVRVTFEQNLTKDRDITLYPRTVNGTPRIEVYEFNKTELIAEFTNLKDNEYNKVYLTNLQGSQDTFDLRIVGGSVEIEHIIDPTQLFFENFEVDLGNWNVVALWAIATDQKDGGTNSSKCAGANDCDMSLLTSLDTSAASEINVTFRFRDDDLDGGGDAPYYWNDSSGNWDLIGEIDAPSASEDTWLTFSNSSTDSQYFHKGFNIRFATTLDGAGGAENLWLDNINVSYTPDTASPLVTINFPTNTTYTSANIPLNFNVTLSETGSVLYSLDNGVNNITMISSADQTSKTGTIFNITNGSIADGVYPFNVYANDTAGNKNYTSSTSFRVETTPPLVTINFPTNTTYSETNIPLNFNVTLSENGSAMYSLDNGVNNVTMISSQDQVSLVGLVFNRTNGSIADGVYSFNVYANDTVGNNNYTHFTSFRIDTITPLISFVSPTPDNYANITSDSINVTVSVTETNRDTTKFYLYNGTGGIVNISNFTSAVNNLNFTGLAFGNYTYNVSINDSAGHINSTGFRYINLSAGAANNAPQIISVFNNSVLGGTLNEGPSNTNFTVNFSVVDTDGASDLNSATAAVNFTKSGEDTRYNWTCAQYQSTGNNANYTCQIMMWWWDGDGAWTINASILDTAGAKATNDTRTFSVSLTTGFVLSPGNITFPSITSGGTNFTASNDPLLLNNTGNDDIDQTAVSINSTNLVGEATSTQALYTGNFSVGNTTGSNAECSAEPIATQMNYTVSGGSFVNITNAVMNASNYTINNGREGQEQLYICLRLAGAELTQQAYSTRSLGSWTVQILSASLIVAGEAARRKRKKKGKNDEVVKLLSQAVGELKEMKSIMKELREKEKISKKEIVEILEVRQKENVPVTIFTRELGGLEALVKYMKENLNMSYSEIAEQLARDERTIWTAYNKAKEKRKDTLEVKKTDIYIPISIFGNRKLTILESVITHLKIKGIKHSEIAKLIDRDQRNVQTIYSRATKKLYKKE